MKRALVLSGWAGNGTARDPYRPRLHDDFPGLTWTDASGLRVAPGATSSIAVTCADDTLEAIKAHPRYAGNVTEVTP